MVTTTAAEAYGEIVLSLLSAMDVRGIAPDKRTDIRPRESKAKPRDLAK